MHTITTAQPLQANHTDTADTSSKNTIIAFMRSICFVQVISLLVSMGIFGLDVATNSHAAIGVLYIVSMIILINQSERTIYLFAIVSSTMLVLDAIFFGRFHTPGAILLDKTISFIALWIVTVGMLRYKALNAIKEQQKIQHAKAIEELLFMTSHNVRKPICTIQGLAQIMDGAVSKEEAEHIVRYIRISADELDQCTEDLTNFIHYHSTRN